MSITIEIHEVDERKLPGGKKEQKGFVVTTPVWRNKEFVTIYQLHEELQKELQFAKEKAVK